MSKSLVCTLLFVATFSVPLVAQQHPADDSSGNGNHIVGPEYRIDPDLTDKGNPKGKYFEFAMPLADSKIFRGDDVTLNPKKPVRKERKIFVYVPDQYKDGTKAPILVMHDGPNRLKLVRNALDNLTISKDVNRKLPAFIAISVQNGGNDSKGSQRGLEYDTMSDRFARFINGEVLPAVLNNEQIREAYPNIAFTTDPWGKASMGCSSGGAATLTMGWFRPDLFRRLITYSGTFVDQQDDDAPEEEKYPLGAWEYHSGMKLIENSEKKPLRIFTHVAENDNGATQPEETYHNWVMANQRTAAALKAKGYDYRYVFSRKSRHCDRRVYEHTLADTLVWMWRGYEPEEGDEQASKVVAVELPDSQPLYEKDFKSEIRYPGGEKVRETSARQGAPSGRNRVFTDVETPTYFLHQADPAKATGLGLVICPGGGYRDVWLDREGHDLAIWLKQFGITSLVLKYRTNGKGDADQRGDADGRRVAWDQYMPAVVSDARQAVRVLRSRAKELKIDSERIGICGFSAGGNLAMSLYLLGGEPLKSPISGEPNFAGLFYPWFRTDAYQAISNYGQLADRELFIMNAADDTVTPTDKCLDFYQRLYERGARPELHIVNKGGHGFDLGDGRGASTALWKKSFVAWLKDRGLMERPNW